MDKRLERVVIAFSKYRSGTKEDEIEFLKMCGARYVYLGEKHMGFFRYYAVREMTVPEDIEICKDGSLWTIHEPLKGATIYIEWGEHANKRIAELNRTQE
jgi:hypothetical protein